MSQASTDIKTMSIEGLKALAYDELAKLEQCNRNLATLNKEISTRSQEQPKEEKK